MLPLLAWGIHCEKLVGTCKGSKQKLAVGDSNVTMNSCIIRLYDIILYHVILYHIIYIDIFIFLMSLLECAEKSFKNTRPAGY